MFPLIILEAVRHKDGMSGKKYSKTWPSWTCTSHALFIAHQQNDVRHWYGISVHLSALSSHCAQQHSIASKPLYTSSNFSTVWYSHRL